MLAYNHIRIYISFWKFDRDYIFKGIVALFDLSRKNMWEGEEQRY
jgi:hypothetical protein